VKNPIVRLKIRVRRPDGSRPFLDPIFSGNGKLKPQYAVINGEAKHFLAATITFVTCEVTSACGSTSAPMRRMHRVNTRRAGRAKKVKI
jgi:hypothetical protein